MDKKIVHFPGQRTTGDKAGIHEGATMKDRIIASLRTVYDPEIPLNLYDLGLIYDIDLEQDGRVIIKMTLTTPHCPVAESMPGQVESVLRKIDGVEEVQVQLVWDPPWSQDCMSDEAKLTLGLL